MHDRDDGDPVKQRVVAGHEALAKLAVEGGAHRRVVISPLFSRRWAARSLGFLFISGSAVGVITLLHSTASQSKEAQILQPWPLPAPSQHHCAPSRRAIIQ